MHKNLNNNFKSKENTVKNEINTILKKTLKLSVPICEKKRQNINNIIAIECI